MDSLEPRPTSHSPRPRTSAEQVAFLARLAGGLAHEIKNPLSTIAINLALLEEEWSRNGATRTGAPVELTPREQRSIRRIKTLQREVGRMETILDEFLRFARGAQINRAPKDIAVLVRELLDFVEPENEQAGIRQLAELAVGMPLCMIDETAFKQAVLNLLKNAREAMPQGGELIVRVRRDGNWAELSVTDTGVGMSLESMQHCFDEYWSDKKGGTGLGLPTARRIVEEHGGTIHVVSEKGLGTSFTIFMPLIVEIARTARDVDDGSDAREVEATAPPPRARRSPSKHEERE